MFIVLLVMTQAQYLEKLLYEKNLVSYNLAVFYKVMTKDESHIFDNAVMRYDALNTEYNKLLFDILEGKINPLDERIEETITIIS